MRTESHQKIISGFNAVVLCLLLYAGTAYTQDSLTGIIELPADFKHHVLMDANGREPFAHLFSMKNSMYGKVRFISRERFDGDLSFAGVEKYFESIGQHLVIQLAAAFTPDWQVIEGFALEDGIRVGQDTFLGENSNLPYKGMLCIRDGKPFITHLDSITDRQAFVRNARGEKWSLFLQAAPIVNNTLDTTLILPGKHKRRFFVETESDSREYGVITFIKRTGYQEAVLFMYRMKEKGLTIKNALYMDMGSVSEGYVYDKNGGKYLIGNSGTYMEKYTNLLVMYRDQ